jgi:hypothetical protein
MISAFCFLFGFFRKAHVNGVYCVETDVGVLTSGVSAYGFAYG